MGQRSGYFYRTVWPLAVLFSFFQLSLTAQFESDFKPIESTSTLPKDYIVDVAAATKLFSQNNQILSQSLAENYFNDLFITKKQIFETGDIYLPNLITKYVDSIANVLLKDEAKLREQIKLYVTRYSSANAFCLADGSIFVNLGLLDKFDNESELAFVIAHEIAHFVKQHSLKDYSKAIEIAKKESSGGGSYASTFRRLRFSRDSELEADSYALSLLASSGFDVGMAEKALEKLRDKPNAEEIDIERVFNNGFFTLDTAIHAADLLKKVKKSVDDRSMSRADSKIDDLYDTHPDVDKRISSIREMERNLSPSKSKTDRNAYKYYKTLVAFEVANNSLRRMDFLNTIINSLRLLEWYPNNSFLLGTVARSLYWICYCKELSKGDLIIYGDLSQNTSSFYALYNLFDRMSLKETKQLAYAYLRSKEEKIAKVAALDFYLAVCTENYLGKDAARSFYKTYQTRFPDGTYSPFVNNKLK